MPITKFLQDPKKLELQPYDKGMRLKDLRKTHVSFSGTPHKHPYDNDKFILVSDPYSSNTYYYEFDHKAVDFIEELPSIVNLEGETVTMVLIWVKKMSLGLRCSPFLVDDTTTTRE